MTTAPATCIAFEGIRRIASGALKDVAIAVKSVVDRGESAPVLIFDSVTSQPVELDLRGSVDEVIGRLAGAEVAPSRTADEEAPRGRGRPKLGVVAREVTLLPRHWAWLNGQPSGASVALRRLVDAARAANEDHDRVRRAQEATYRFMTALAGNLPGFEDATRALFAMDRPRFDDLTAQWPADVRDHVRRLSDPALDA